MIESNIEEKIIIEQEKPLRMTAFKNYAKNCNKIDDRNNLTDATGDEPSIYNGLTLQEEIYLKSLKVKQVNKRKYCIIL
jgi:hypothetical protein